jgi:amino acid adenylation domain-containing protein
MVLLAAFQSLLARHTGLTDIAVGTPVAGRNWVETENLIGIFVNILVLRADLAGNPTFREVLARVRETCRGAYGHQDLPFEKLVEALRPQRDLSTTPLFQVMFNLENLPDTRCEVPGLRIEQFDFERLVADYDLTVEIAPTEGQLKCSFEYDSDLFDPRSIQRMAGHYRTLLEGIVAEPERRMASLPLLTPAERHQILIEWNDTEAEYPRDATLHELFEAQAARTPEATAFLSESGNVSYRDLNCRANQLARYLLSQGAGPESFVGVCLERSPEGVVALLGALKAGAAFLPLDPGYPRERLAFMIEDSQIPLVISRGKWLALVRGKGARVICLDTDHHLIEAQEEGNVLSEPTLSSVAYVLYTSGSSGVPKGVLGLHRGAVNRFAWMWKNFPFQADDVCCLKTSLNFGDSIWEVFGPLLQGIPSLIISDRTVRDPVELLQALASHGVTRIVIVPSLLQVLLERYPDLGNRLPRLKLWVSSGEALLPDLCKQFYAAMPTATLLNLYGSTEVSADVTAHLIPSGSDEGGAVPLGRPIDNTRCYVLDAQLQPVPTGVHGDLYVGGEGLARGYHNRPELTAESFLKDPFSADPEARLYKTGDRARYLPDGTLLYLGRSDRQFKIRGFRIEPGEIETALTQHPAVSAAAVELRGEAQGEKRLAAFIVPRQPAKPPSSKALRDFLKEMLPEYMVPADFFTLEALPRTPSGKLDRRALPTGSRSPETVNNYVPPSDSEEWHLVKIWEEILGVRPIGVRDDFFDLGGHSFLAMRMMDRIANLYGKRLPLATLFAGATIANLANCLRLENLQEVGSAIAPVQLEGSYAPFFFLHGDHHGGLYCRLLARGVGSDQPFYGVMPNGFDEKPFLPTVEAMAEENIRLVIALQPHGPYLLGGYCNGGLVAYEMARQMNQQGLEVGPVILLEAAVPRHIGWLKTLAHCSGRLAGLDLDRRALLYVRLRNYFTRSHWAYAQGIGNLLRIYSQTIRKKLGAVTAGSEKPGNGFLGFAELLDSGRYAQFVRIISGYRPQPYQGRVVLLRTNYLDYSYPTDRTAGWGRVAPHIEVQDLPGSHESCLVEHIGDVAQHIASSLREYFADVELASPYAK